MKLKLKKMLTNQEEFRMMEQLIRTNDRSIQIWENGVVIYERLKQGCSLGYEYVLSFPELSENRIKMDREDKSLQLVIEYIVKNEIEKKLLATEVLDKYKEISVLYNISERIAVNPDVASIAESAFFEFQKYVRFNYGTLFLKDGKDGGIKRVFEFGGEQDAYKYMEDDKIVKRILEEGIFDIVNDINKSPYKLKDETGGSLVGGPIHVKGVPIGAILVGNDEKNIFHSNDLKLMIAISFLLGVSIENVNLFNSLQETFFQTVAALSETIEKRDVYTGGHVQRVMKYCMTIGETLGLTKDELRILKMAALMHDIGKIGIEDRILRKGERLTEEEYELMKMHTVYGAEIIQNIAPLREIIPGVRNHHERFDGKGYPDGLAGEEISIIGRIISVADTLDAMITDRPYRKGLPISQAMNELQKYAGDQFDPKVVEAFIQAVKEGRLEI